jgi:hypothetical protein
MALREFTDWLLEQKSPAKWLNLTDAYIQTFKKVGSSTFVLPKEHAKLKGGLEAFVDDPTTFVEYTKAVRDSLEGHAKAEVHAVYRTLLTRDMQSSRRERMNRALKVYEAANGKIADRLGYLKFLEQAWAKERLEYMKKYRYGKQRLTTDERNEVLLEFWQMIDDRISNGELPNGYNAPMES